jgi:glyoxylase-like metal-dependent hydrolase (beta-lactamase superfamily II)
MRARLRVPVMAHSDFAGQAVDRALADGDTIAVGKHRLKTHHAPGHTPDQVCFSVEQDDRVIVGDAVFEGGPGQTCSLEDFQTTLDTLRRVILAWPDKTPCTPGHGGPFRLGAIRSAVEAFIARDHGRICRDAAWGM